MTSNAIATQLTNERELDYGKINIEHKQIL
jgi:hypothetical protein